MDVCTDCGTTHGVIGGLCRPCFLADPDLRNADAPAPPDPDDDE